MTPAARATRIVRSVPFIVRRSPSRPVRASGVEDVGEQPADLAGAQRQLEAAVAELEHRDRREERALPLRIGRDVALDDAGPGGRRRGVRRGSP